MYKAKLVKPREEINYTAGALNPALSRAARAVDGNPVKTET